MAPATESDGNACRDSPDGIEQHNAEPIAVIGFSLRFPQEATSPESFWEMLCEGRSAMTEVPSDRFNINGFYHPDASRTDTVGDLSHTLQPNGQIGRGSHMKADQLSRCTFLERGCCCL